MAVSLRRLRPDETRTFLEVHHTAVRVTAATDYSSEVVEAWAPLPITEDAVQSVLASAAAEIRVAAVSREKIVGIGVLELALLCRTVANSGLATSRLTRLDLAWEKQLSGNLRGLRGLTVRLFLNSIHP
jgi:hypothetical protein